MRYTMWFLYSRLGRSKLIQIESVKHLFGRYSTLTFVDKSIKPETYGVDADIIYIAARIAVLPDNKEGMLYQPCVLSQHQIYDTLWNYWYQRSPNFFYRPSKLIRELLLKLDNLILNASKIKQDEFVLTGLRWDKNEHFTIDIDNDLYLENPHKV